MANEVIYNKQTVSGFAFDSAKGAFKTSLSSAFTLTAGQYYEIGWDGKTFTRKAYTLNGDSTVYIGNELRQKNEFDDITEPFIVAYVPGTNKNLFYAYDTNSSHIVSISTAEEPNSVLVKDWHGKDHEFTGHDTVYIRNAGGDAQPYTHGLLGSDIETPADFSGGDMVLTAEDGDFLKKATVLKPETLIPDNVKEGVTVAGVEGALKIPEQTQLSVDLDFSDGGMTFTPESGKVFSKVSIPTPANLLPENIAKDVNVAGIIGTLSAKGASNICVKTFTAGYSYTALNSNVTLIPKEDLDEIGFGTASKKFAILLATGTQVGTYGYYVPTIIVQTNYAVVSTSGSNYAYGMRQSAYKSSSSASYTSQSMHYVPGNYLSTRQTGYMVYNTNGLQYYGGSNYPLLANTYIIIAGVIS